jgi:acyl carrier protein
MTSPNELIAQVLAETFQVPADQLHPDTSLGDLGLDSLAIAELEIVLGQRAGLSLRESDLSEETALGALADMLTHAWATNPATL